MLFRFDACHCVTSYDHYAAYKGHQTMLFNVYDLLDLFPWQCLRGMQRQLLYDPSPGCSVLCNPCSFLDRRVE